MTLGALVFLYLFHNAQLLLRAQHVHGRHGRSRSSATSLLPDRAAALLPRVGLRGLASRTSPASTHDNVAVNALFNPYAAVPSMHVALRADDRRSRSRGCASTASRGSFWAVYPLLVIFVIVATGNHFLARRRPRRADRRRSPRTPRVARARAAEAWAFSPRAGHGLMPPPTRAAAPPGGARAPSPGERRELVRNRLIESRLTPNAISMTGLVLNVVAAVLVWQSSYSSSAASRSSSARSGHARRALLAHVGQGHAVRRVPGLDARPHRGGHRPRPRSPPYFATQRQGRRRRGACVVAVLASLMVSYTRARAEALGVECKVGIASRAVRVVILSIGLLFAKVRLGDFELLAPAVYVLAGAEHDHRPAAHLPRPQGARPRPRAAVTGNRRRLGVRCPRTSWKGPLELEHQRQRRAPTTDRDQRRGALPARQGPRRDHRRRQLRELVRAGRPPLRATRIRDEPVPGLMHVDLGGYHV